MNEIFIKPERTCSIVLVFIFLIIIMCLVFWSCYRRSLKPIVPRKKKKEKD